MSGEELAVSPGRGGTFVETSLQGSVSRLHNGLDRTVQCEYRRGRNGGVSTSFHGLYTPRRLVQVDGHCECLCCSKSQPKQSHRVSLHPVQSACIPA